MPFGVGGIERIGNFDGDIEHSLDFERPPGNDVLQRRALQIFHHDERTSIVLADFVDGADVGMIQRGSRARFAAEAFERLRILGHFIGQKLQSDETAQPGVFGLVNYAHAAAAEFFNDAIVRDVLADH